MNYPHLYIPDSVVISLISEDPDFTDNISELLSAFLTPGSRGVLNYWGPLHSFPEDLLEKESQLIILDIRTRDLEAYLDFIRNIKTRDSFCLCMAVLQADSADKLDLLESETTIDDAVLVSSADDRELSRHVYKNLKIIRNFSSHVNSSAPLFRNTDHSNDELARLKAALDNTSEGILITDMANAIWYINEAFGYLFGYTANRIAEIGLNSLVQEDLDLQKLTSDSDIQALRRDGSQFPCNLKYTEILNNEYEPVGKIFIFTDLSDRVRAEEKRQEMARAYGVIEMAGAAAHEINQPLQAISLISEWLILQGGTDDAAYPYLQNIHSECQRIGKITSNIQKIARSGSYQTKDYLAGEKIVDIFSVDK